MRRALALLLLALAAPQLLPAQGPALRNGLGLDSLRFGYLQARLASRDSVRVTGTFGAVVLRRPTLTPDSLVAATPRSGGTPVAPLALTEVTRIQVRGGASGTGALIGAGVGLAAGIAASVSLHASLCSGGGCSNEAGGSAVIVLGSTIGGALLGALVGLPVRKWHTVFSRR